MRKILPIFIFLVISNVGITQVNLDFEQWVLNYNGIDEAKYWLNTSDASEYNAPQTLFKEKHHSSTNGQSAIRLTTAYWDQGASFGVDTLVGSLLQQHPYNKQPDFFEFDYQAYPKKGDAVLVGIQLSMTINDSIIIIGEGFFTSSSIQDKWTKQKVNIEYYSGFTPDKISVIALSSANAVLIDGGQGNIKIGSTLLLDNLLIGTSEKEQKPNYYMYVFPNPVKSYINIETNDPKAKTIQIYSLQGKLALTHPIIQKDRLKIDLSFLPNGTYIYRVYGDEDIITSNKFNIVR